MFKKQKELIYIRFQNICYETRNWAQVHSLSIDHAWDVSTTWLESTYGKFNWLDMIWKGTHLSIEGPTVDRVCQSKNQAMRSKEISVELRDRIVSRHRSGERYQNISAALKVPKNTVASIILKWKKFGTTKTLPRAGCWAKLSNRGRRAAVREVTISPHKPIPRWPSRNFTELYANWKPYILRLHLL